MDDNGKSTGSGTWRRTVAVVSLLVVLPLIYAACVLLFWNHYYELTYHGWKQVHVSEIDVINIPKDWDYQKSEDRCCQPLQVPRVLLRH